MESNWPDKYLITSFLDENNISLSLQKLPKRVKDSFSSIKAGEKIYLLKKNGELLQALIAVDKNKQLHLHKDINGTYKLDIIPIAYHMIEDMVSVQVNKGLKKEIEENTHNQKLTFLLGKLINNKTLFHKLQPDTRVVFRYTQKERLGKAYGQPHINSALIKLKDKSFFAYTNKKGINKNGIYKKVPYTVIEKRPFTYTTVKKIPAPFFRMPVSHPRITSPFSLRRWHPIQHKYKPHHGVDFGGKTGTSLYATDDGVVIYAGWMNGYGKTTKIRHAGGFVSLYGHQSRIMVRKGMKVKRGAVIGKMGSTGRSTGPHLHYGLYLRNRPVNPMKYIGKRASRKPKILREKHTVIKEYPVKKYKDVLIPYAKRLKEDLEKQTKSSNDQNYQWNTSEQNIIHINDIIIDTKPKKEAENG
jgi:murein DD-endopeptidase MepM/ murein hydrolase activator NlpD